MKLLIAKAADGRSKFLLGLSSVVGFQPLGVWHRFLELQLSLCFSLRRCKQILLLLTLSNCWLGRFCDNRDRTLVCGFLAIFHKNALIDSRYLDLEIKEL